MKISAYIFRICKKKIKIFAFCPSFWAKRLKAYGFFRFFRKSDFDSKYKKIFSRCPHARGPVGSPKQALFKNVFRFVLSQSARKLSPFPFF